MGLQELMQKIGESGEHVFVRYDPEREIFRWTVMIGNGPRLDSDDPVRALLGLLARRSEWKMYLDK